jgi:hypothetical protein
MFVKLLKSLLQKEASRATVSEGYNFLEPHLAGKRCQDLKNFASCSHLLVTPGKASKTELNERFMIFESATPQNKRLQRDNACVLLAA